MESGKEDILKKKFNKESKIVRMKNKNEESITNYNDIYYTNDTILKGNKYTEKNISFRKEYKNNKIRNKNINRTLSDIYSTINSINKINNKIYKIFNKRKNTNENNKSNYDNNDTKVINNYFYGKNSMKNKIFNEIKNKSNKEKSKKNLIRTHYSSDNIFKKRINSLMTKKQSEKKEENKQLDDNSILYISSYITEELNKNQINNKLNYDYNDFHLRDKLNNVKNDKKLKRNQTYNNIFALNHFRNSKNFKDIVKLEEYKQNEIEKLENIKHFKKNYQINELSNEKKELNKYNINLDYNKKTSNKKPFFFNDIINKSSYTTKHNNNSFKTTNINSYLSKIFSIKNEKKQNETEEQKIYNRNYNTSIMNKLNFNYQIYKNILNNN